MINDDNDNTHFGFKEVTSKEKTKLVGEVFTAVAKKYDVMNDAMSLGIHRWWKDEMLKEINNFNGRLLDLAGGTGDIARRFYLQAKIKGVENPRIVLTDINSEMLEAGRDNMINANILHNVDYLLANAEELPFDDMSFDYVTIAFGIRNVTFIDKALQEIYRVLRPGGKFICLEFSHVSMPLLAKLYKLYSFYVIPKLGQIIANDGNSYKYLVESIEKFPKQQEFADRITASGFRGVNYRSLSAAIVTIHYGWRV